MLIRHAEKPSGDAQGVDERGNPDPASLSVRGWQRAGALVRYFSEPERMAGPYAVERPVALYAARSHPRSARPVHTVEPLARALQLSVNADHASDAGPDALLAAATAWGGPVLICWRHETLPDLARSLLGDDVAPFTWDEHCYDRVWVLARVDGQWQFRETAQRLLDGDARVAAG
jgi:hypothetical protein